MLNDKSVNLVSHNPHPPSKPVELCLICVADGWSCENPREREERVQRRGKLEISSFFPTYMSFYTLIHWEERLYIDRKIDFV